MTETNAAETNAAVTITYCTQCNWVLRASWMATELLNTFGTELGSVTLVPGTGGVFSIDVDGELIWERKRDKGFPDIVTLKKLVRNVAAPEWDLGHADKTDAEQA
ncbi:SelT/SelW/SelH family protein [Williamsia soli]|uniref:SelT/SelW/SelH family protein n=1 Tax=Williamsia soli TaxID=364929 RepID=UPI0027DCBD4C|nr:SelT/SelW/SelH family protein [Williamsia soli]